MPKSTYQIKLPRHDKWKTRSRFMSFHESVKVQIMQPVSEPLTNNDGGEDIQQKLWFTIDELIEIRISAMHDFVQSFEQM